MADVESCSDLLDFPCKEEFGRNLNISLIFREDRISELLVLRNLIAFFGQTKNIHDVITA
jgi:hypothetical protein